MIALLLLGIFIAIVFGKNGVAFLKGLVSLCVGVILLIAAASIV